MSGILGDQRFVVLHADNRDVLGGLRPVDHVITDPPYEAQAHTLGRRLNGKATGEGREVLEAPLSFSAITEDERREAGLQIGRLAKRWCVVFSQVEAVHKWSEVLEAAGAKTKRIGVWVKPDAMPQFSGDRPGMGYESIVFTHAPGRSRWNGGGRVGVFVHNKNTPGGALDHETQKPLNLMLELVELFTDPDDIVLDPYCGSGTTGVACLRLGRRFIGIEKDATYAQLAKDRLEAEVRGLSLRDARAGQTSIFDAIKQP